jgi:hypothetical protein
VLVVALNTLPVAEGSFGGEVEMVVNVSFRFE